MKQLILIRHGETEYSRMGRFCGESNPLLNRRGVEQAAHLGSILATEQIDLISTSPLNRCIETAVPIGVGREIQIEDDLREISFGIFEGKTSDECERDLPLAWKMWCNEHYIDGAELPSSFEKRVKQILKRFEKSDAETVVIVTHGGVIRLMLSYLLWGNSKNQWRVKVEPGTIARVEIDDGFAFLKSLNEGI